MSDWKAKRKNIEQRLGTYGSPDEASIFVQKRVWAETEKIFEPTDNDPEVGEQLDKLFCPITKVVKMEDPVARKLRHEILHETITMESLLAAIISNFNRLPFDFLPQIHP